MSEGNNTNINTTGYVSNLFRAVRPNDGLGADVLIPGHVDNSDYVVNVNQEKKQIVNSPASFVVDVHSSYAWTLSPEFARRVTPVIEITEYKQVLSSELMGYAYSLAGVVDNFRVAAVSIPTATAAGAAVTKKATSALSFIPGAGVVGNIANFIGNTALNTGFVTGVERLQEMNKPAKEASDKDAVKNDPNNAFLSPYRGLYAVEPTGFIYRLPYKDDINFTQTNGWGDPERQVAKALGSVLETLTGKEAAPVAGGKEAGGEGFAQAAGTILDVAKGVMTTTGGVVHAEKPKSYQGPQSVDSVTVKFILYNTIKFEDIKKNWELCYLLSYQNLPNRKGINLMDPPKLYRLLIPGYKQFPMCWVSNLEIKNLGAVRMVDIDDPNNISVNLGLNATAYSPSIKLIPEAYEIKITFEHAFYSSQNLFAYALQPSNVVTTTTSLTETLRGTPETAPTPQPPTQ